MARVLMGLDALLCFAPLARFRMTGGTLFCRLLCHQADFQAAKGQEMQRLSFRGVSSKPSIQLESNSEKEIRLDSDEAMKRRSKTSEHPQVENISAVGYCLIASSVLGILIDWWRGVAMMTVSGQESCRDASYLLWLYINIATILAMFGK